MKKRLIKSVVISVALSAAMASSAFAADGKALYDGKGCAGCHGADAKTPVMPSYPKIAGQNKEYLEEQLKDIKSGARNNGQTAAMKAIMASVSDEDIPTLAEYLAGLK